MSKLPAMIPLEVAMRACTIAEERLCGMWSGLTKGHSRARSQKYTREQWYDFEKDTARFCLRAAIRAVELGDFDE